MEIRYILKNILMNNEIDLFKSWLFDLSLIASNDLKLDNEIKKKYEIVKSYILNNKFEIKCGKVNHCNAGSYEHILMYEKINEKCIIDNSQKKEISELVKALDTFCIAPFIEFFDENFDKNLRIICYEADLQLGNKLFQLDYETNTVKSYSERHVDKNGFYITYHCCSFTNAFCE